MDDVDQKIAIVRSIIEEITRLDRDTVSIPVLIAASIEEAEDILDALEDTSEDDIQQLPDTVGLRAFNNVLFVDRKKEM